MENKVAPIKPSEVSGLQNKAIPSVVIEAFNELILKNFKSGSARIVQDTVVELIVGKGLSRRDIFENNWLDVEDLYRKNGWKVEYDKPGYNESYNAYFVFSAKTK